MLKQLAVDPKHKRGVTFNMSLTIMPDGKVFWRGKQWNAPIIVPDDHEDLNDTLRRSPFILKDFKPEKLKPTIKKEV